MMQMSNKSDTGSAPFADFWRVILTPLLLYGDKPLPPADTRLSHRWRDAASAHAAVNALVISEAPYTQIMMWNFVSSQIACVSARSGTVISSRRHTWPSLSPIYHCFTHYLWLQVPYPLPVCVCVCWGISFTLNSSWRFSLMAEEATNQKMCIRIARILCPLEEGN